ncbi:MAG: PPOX class F420-dependent oxidoreductase [Actinomycetota bacterium]|nr:PPOX class F420-dependent oxidoreductase [Actinomycetota bacterium]
MSPADALEFVSENHRAVLITRKADGGIQSSPVTVGSDDERVVISSRETAYKTRNLRRDPRAVLCVFTDKFYGKWMQIEGDTEIVPLPEAMELLVDYYRRIRGEHPDWDEYRAVMEKERRVLLRVAIEKVGPTRAG